MRNYFRQVGLVVAALLAFGSATTLQASAALTDDQVVSANPVNYTPNVNQGAVISIAKVGNTMVAVGKFTTVTDFHGVTFNRTNIFAFNADTGEVSTTFTPTVDGTANRVVASGDGSSVYIVGAFKNVNGAPASHAARVSVTNGSAVPGFKAAATNGVINDAVLRNGKLYIGGGFKKVAGKPRTLLAALNADTGADTGAVASTVTDVFNGGSTTVKALDVSLDGSRMVAIGNFRTVDGQNRPQIAMWDTTVTPAARTSWSTQGFTHPCAANAFDTYMRDVSISDDNDYFAVATTGAFDGGVNNGSLCDTMTRWELGATGGDQQPTWADYSGGDTFYAVSAIGRIIYVGGHNRWVNNPYAGDAPGAGAVDRPGISAFDSRNGLPFSWNPTRARGVGLREFLPLDNGLWVAHDTRMLGHETRKRIAFLPLAGGRLLPPENTGSLPGNVYTAGTLPGANGHWVARVNAGGSTMSATDNGPDWSADTDANPSPYHGGNVNIGDFTGQTYTEDTSVPAYVPNGVFSTERWSPNDSPNMQWDFSAPRGNHLTVNLYFANGCSCTTQAGDRKFDVSVEGLKRLDSYDIIADVGNQRGVLKTVDIPISDGNVDIDFGHVLENPLINAIEIIDNNVAAPGAGSNDTLTKHVMNANGSTNGDPQTVASGEDWGNDRGAFMVDGTVYYGDATGAFRSRTYNGTTLGTEQTINLDPAKANGTAPAHTFHADIANITGMFYDKATARMYYTLAGQSRLYYRYFLPESEIVGAVRITGPDSSVVDWSKVSGMFLANGRLYYGNRTDGSLHSVQWNGGNPAGPDQVENTPAHDWRARATFLYAS